MRITAEKDGFRIENGGGVVGFEGFLGAELY